MKEPENHTLRLLREFRDEFRDFRAQTTDNFARTTERIDKLARMMAGDTVLGRYAAAGVEERLTAIEKRLSTLERRR